MSPYIATIRTGPERTDRIAFHFRAVGTVEQMWESARVKCGQAIATRGRLVYVCIEDANNVPLRSGMLCEDGRGNYSTELTEIGEQTVIPGCERQTTPKNPQGELFS